MIEAVIFGLMGVCGLAVLFCGWGFWCNERTGRERQQIIDWIFRPEHSANGRWLQLNTEYERVTYEQHMWARVWFRDPRKLYPQSWDYIP